MSHCTNSTYSIHSSLNSIKMLEQKHMLITGLSSHSNKRNQHLDMDQSQFPPVIGIPIDSSVDDDSYRAEVASTDDLCHDCKLDRKDSIRIWLDKLRMKASYRIQGIREYVRDLQLSKTERVFRKAFSADGSKVDEKLIKSLRCFLSTTAGPIAGMLVISTEKIAFMSDKPLQLPAENGEVVKFRYKVVIPLARVKKATPMKNLEMPSKKYVRIVTVDEYDFWFMEFAGDQKFFR